MVRALFLFFLLVFSFIEAKLPKIDSDDVKTKVEEIFQAHVTYKNLNPELVKRLLANFIEELDPSKLYFIKSDIANYLEPNARITSQVLIGYKNGDYGVFDEIHAKFLEAVKRRNLIEDKLTKLPLLTNVNKEEKFSWAESEEELISRLLKLRSLQVEVIDKLSVSQDLFFKTIKERRKHLENEIADPKTKKVLILTYYLKAFASSLDDHTTYFTPSEAEDFVYHLQQKLYGIGVALQDNLNGFKVVRILPDSPASNTNKIKVNDLIISVNNEPVLGLEYPEVLEKIRGEKGTPVELTVLRKKDDGTEEKLNIKILRGEIVIEEQRITTTFDPYGDGVIAHIKLHCFYQDRQSSSADDVRKALEAIKKEHKLKGAILDIRNNGGGPITQAVAVSSLFITKGVVVSTKENTGFIQHYRNQDVKVFCDVPLIVLTDRTSASASEIVAQALQDYGRALIVGDDRTFGKGSFQSFTLDTLSAVPHINPKGEYKVTRGEYYTVSGKSPQLTGVPADITVPGFLSELDIGEKFGKYPLANESIAPSYVDDLADIPAVHRKKVSLLYNHNLQPIITKYKPYIGTLKSNSESRIANSTAYQSFLKDVKEKKFDQDSIQSFAKNDLQYLEALNIIKDLVYLEEVAKYDN